MTEREAETLESEPVEDDDEETAGTTSYICDIFKDALYRWIKVLKDAGKPLPISHAY